jgi:hypothetical protein
MSTNGRDLSSTEYEISRQNILLACRLGLIDLDTAERLLAEMEEAIAASQVRHP